MGKTKSDSLKEKLSFKQLITGTLSVILMGVPLWIIVMMFGIWFVSLLRVTN